MVKKVKKFLSVSLIILLMTMSFSITKVNAATYSLTPNMTAKIGETVTITATVTAGGWELYLSGAGQNESLAGNTDILDNKTVSLSIKFTPTTSGTFTFILSGNITDFYSQDYNAQDIYQTCVVTVPEEQSEQGGNTNPDPGTTEPGDGNETSNPGTSSGEQNPPSSGENNNNLPAEQTPAPEPEPQPKSNNNYLRSLKVDKGTLTPAFSREREDYTIEFPEDFDFSTLDKINVSAIKENNAARINGTGDITVKEGENVIEINVMAEDQTVRTYRITFIKPEIITQSDLRLKSLIVKAIDEDEKSEDVELEPKFDTEVFNYKLNVKENIEKLQIDAQVERDDIIVAIEGADKLHAGKNLIKITLTSPTDENVKSVYQITVDKERTIVASTNPTEGVLSSENRTKLIMGIVLGIIAILGITLIVLLAINHKKNKQQQAGNEDDETYDRLNKKKDKEELEEKKQKLFDYEEEKSYLTDENLEKLSKEYKDAVKDINNEDLGKEVKHQIIGDEIEAKEKTKKEKTDKVADNMDFEEENKNSSYDKLAELLERKEYTASKEEEKEEEGTFNKEDFLNDIKNKKGKHF